MNSDKLKHYLPTFLLFAVILGVPILFIDTIAGMIHIWENSDSFTHGYLIFPITLWLIWQKKNQLAYLPITPDARFIVLVIAGSLLWLIANLVDVKIIQQFAMIGLIVVTAATILGKSIVIYTAFPLFFLFLAVPFGKGLISPLMEFTADFTVIAINTIGIPVYREGLFFTLPSGRWSVVEACSGLNYLIASLTLGLLYSYLSYNKFYKRTIFVGIIVIISILANGMRALGIVLIGHVTNMEYGTGDDHTFYGWIFYGLVVFLIFYIGSYWRDEPLDQRGFNNPQPSLQPASNLKHITTVTVISFLVLAAAPLYVKLSTTALNHDKTEKSFDLAADINGWRINKTSEIDWKPKIKNAVISYSGIYIHGTDQIQVTVAYYPDQSSDAELISSSNRLITFKSDWIRISSTKQQIAGLSMKQSVLNRGEQKLLVWSWFRVGEQHTANPYIAKVLQVYNQIIHQRNDGAWIILATPINSDIRYSQDNLGDFLEAALDHIDDTIEQTRLELVSSTLSK